MGKIYFGIVYSGRSANRSVMFPCTSCGLCCQNITNVIELNDFDRGNGVCKYLNLISNQCEIYDDRPDICRVDKMYKKEYSHVYTKEAFYIENAKVCNTLQEQYKVDSKYRVTIGD